jgi:hypothetical protein
MLGIGLSLLAGCLVDATLDAKGGGTLTLKYRLTTEAQLQSAKKRLMSPDVVLVSAEVDAAKWATFELKFDDITKLSTTEFFNKTTFSLTRDTDGTTLTVKIANANPSVLPADMVEYFGNDVVITMHFPGTVVDSNATATDGTTATWKYRLKEFTNMRQIDLHARYQGPPGGESPPAGADQRPASRTPAREPEQRAPR